MPVFFIAKGLLVVLLFSPIKNFLMGAVKNAVRSSDKEKLKEIRKKTHFSWCIKRMKRRKKDHWTASLSNCLLNWEIKLKQTTQVPKILTNSSQLTGGLQQKASFKWSLFAYIHLSGCWWGTYLKTYPQERVNHVWMSYSWIFL